MLCNFESIEMGHFPPLSLESIVNAKWILAGCSGGDLKVKLLNRAEIFREDYFTSMRYLGSAQKRLMPRTGNAELKQCL